jgi:serine/threonine protein kinase
MPTTTIHEITPTVTRGGNKNVTSCPEDLLNCYQSIVERERLSWTEHHRLEKLLGSGGQGLVYLSSFRGADCFTLPVAVKIFSPERYNTAQAYEEAMGRMARVAARVAQIQQDNLLDVFNFVDRNRIRMMIMEWVDGYDLRQLLTPRMLKKIEDRVSQRRWEYINRVIVTAGPIQPRIKPGVAVAIVRECLGALSALHRDGIVHGDIKPSNIMLKRAGSAKIVDIGSAFDLNDAPIERSCTPAYAAPEVLEGDEATPRSDLASLGYVLIEMLSGRPPFAGLVNYRDLLEAKRFLAQRLPSILPESVVCNELLMSFCRGLIAPDPMRRFPTAEAADLRQGGAAAFLRQLIISDLAVEYDHEVHLWIEELREAEEKEKSDA